MTEVSLPMPTGSSGTATGHLGQNNAALLQEALHDSRRATFTREFGEIRGIHRLSIPTDDAATVDRVNTAAFVSTTTEPPIIAAHWVHPPANRLRDASLDAKGDQAPGRPQYRDPLTEPMQHTDPQLRDLIQDFKERQRKVGLVVAGSVASAVALTLATITLVFAIAT